LRCSIAPTTATSSWAEETISTVVDAAIETRYRAASWQREIRKEAAVSERAEALARRFERAHAEFVAVIAHLSDDQWQTVCADEQRTVAALAHHVAVAYTFEIDAFAAIADGRPSEALTWAFLADVNAEDGAAYAACDRDETVALLCRNAGRAAAIVRTFDDAQLAHTGYYVEGVPALTVDQWLRRVLVGHITGHLDSIRTALGLERTSPGAPERTPDH
jgi:hypothetical protein